MILHEEVEIQVHGKKREVEIESYSRGGTKSPSLWIIRLDGKRIVPYGNKKAGIRLTFTTFLSTYISKKLLREEMLKPRPAFFDTIEKHDAWKGAVITIPLCYNPK